MSDAARVADATGNWVDTRAPRWSRPYLRLARLDRPIGSRLLPLPCWGSAALAPYVAHHISRLPPGLALSFLGSSAMLAAGCTWTALTQPALYAHVQCL